MAAPEGYTKLGNVGYADKGVYSADATYNKYNTVYHEGSTYVALRITCMESRRQTVQTGGIWPRDSQRRQLMLLPL